MAVNRYSQPAQAQFANTYVPIPFEEMLAAGQSKQQRYDVNQAQFLDKKATADQLNYIANSQDEKYIREVVHPTFESVAEEFGTQDYSDPVVVRAINKRLNTAIDKERVKRIQQSYEGYSQYQKELQRLGMEGKLAPYLNQFDPTRFDSQFEIFNKLPQAAVDYHTEGQKYFKDIDPSSYLDPNTGQIISYVDKNKILQAINTGASSWMGSEAGRQAVEDYRYRTGDTETPDEIVARQALLDIGMPYTERNVHGFAPEHILRGKEDTSNTVTFGGGTPIVGLHDRYSNLIDKLEPKTRTRPNADVSIEAGMPTKASLSGGGWKKETYYKNLTPEEQTVVNNIGKNLFPNVSKREELYPKIISILGKINDQEISSYAESVPMLKYPSGKFGAEGLTESIFGGTVLDPKKVSGEYYNRKFYDPETNKVYSGKQFLDKHGSDTEVRVLNQYNYRHPFSVLTDDDNFSKSYQIVAGNKQYVMSSGTKEEIQGINIIPRQKALNSISKAIYTPGIDIPIKVYGQPATVTGTPDGFVLDIEGDKFIGKTEDDVLRQVEDFYNE